MNPTQMEQRIRDGEIATQILEGDENAPMKTLSYRKGENEEKGKWVITKFTYSSGQVSTSEEIVDRDIASLEIRLLFAKRRAARRAARRKGR